MNSQFNSVVILLYHEKALKLCDEARKANPQNTKADEEIKELQQRLKAFSK